jgi:hypothetical protein
VLAGRRVPFDATAHPVAAGMAAAGENSCWAAGPRWPPASRRSAASPAESMRQTTRRAEQRAARLPAKARRSARIGAARQMIAAEGLATVDGMIARCRGGGRPAPDYEIARLTVALRDLRVRDDAWARMDPAHADAHLRLWTDLTRRAQPGHLAAPAALLALASSRQHQVMARVVIRPAQGRRPPSTSTGCRGVTRVKRLALVACPVHTARMQARDDLAEMPCKRMAANAKRARAELDEIRLRQRAGLRAADRHRP